MDITRAKQILGSEENIEVLHRGSPVWIEDISSENNTAKVRHINGREHVKEVSVAELVEG